MIDIPCTGMCPHWSVVVGTNHYYTKITTFKASYSLPWGKDEIEQHEREVGVHVLAAIDKLHKENLELKERQLRSKQAY